MNATSKNKRVHAINVQLAAQAVVMSARNLPEGQIRHVVLTLPATDFDFLEGGPDAFRTAFRDSTLAIANAHLARRPFFGRLASLSLERGDSWLGHLTIPPDASEGAISPAQALEQTFYFVIPGAKGSEKIRFESGERPRLPSRQDAEAPFNQLRTRLAALRPLPCDQSPRWKNEDAHIVAGQRVLLFSIS